MSGAPTPPVVIRPMTAADTEPVARLHATSWRSAYRGMVRDDYLDGPVWDERLAHWRRRWAQPQAGQAGVVAEGADGLAGFAFAYPDRHPLHGTLLDNLHVRPGGRGQGLGRRLLHALSAALREAGVRGGLYLEVLAANEPARRFYQRLGAVAVEASEAAMPDGSRLPEWVYAWPDLGALHAATAPGGGALDGRPAARE